MQHIPALGNLTVRRSWAGLRTFSMDQGFVIGPDPRLEGFFWVAGLGGHGMTTSAAVGELATDLLLGRSSFINPHPILPERCIPNGSISTPSLRHAS